MNFRTAQLALFLLIAACAMLFSGCATSEPDNVSVRPWNSPKGWEGSALGGMDYQRR
jgi:hypothetical protein